MGHARQRSLAMIALVSLGTSVAIAPSAHAQPTVPPAPAPAAPAPLTKPPTLLQAAAPEFPPAALAQGKTATVTVRIGIDADGVVTEATVPKPVGDGFDEAARQAALQYVFEPAEFGGVPGPIVVEIDIHFTIEQTPVEPPPPTPSPPRDGPPHIAGDRTQPVSVRGQVVERGTRRKVAGAIVSLAELELDAITNDAGAFEFHGIAPGTYTVIASEAQFDRFTRTVSVVADEEVDVRLWMRPRGGNPYETLVEGEREVLEVTKRTLRRAQLTSVPGTFGDPLRVIQSLPGLARAPFGLGVLLIRGSNADDTGVYIDGHRVPLLYHFLGGPSILNADMVDSIDLYPGGFPARFGRGHGGVVAIETRATEADGVHGAADVDLLDAGGYVRAPITKDIAVAIAGRRSYVDAFLGAVLPEPDPGGQLVVVPIYYDYQARVDANLHRHGKVSMFVLGSSDKLDVLSSDPGDEASLNLNSSVSFIRLIASYKRALTGDLALTLSHALGRSQVSFAGGQADTASPFTSVGVRQTTFSYRARVDGRLSKRVVIDTGLDLESKVTRYTAVVPIDDDFRNTGGIDIPPQLIERSAEDLALGIYADVGIDLSAKLRLVPSARVDGYVLNGQLRASFDPRLVARYAIAPTVTGKAYLGLFHQPPQPEALDDRLGNPDVGVERGTHVGVGVEWKPDRLWSYDAEVFVVDRNNQVVFESGDESDDGEVAPSNFTNAGRRYAYGLEMLLKREISERAFGWVSYTFAKSWLRDRDDGSYSRTAFDQTHNLNAILSVKPGGGWELGAKLRLSSGRAVTPRIDGTYDADTGGYEPVFGETRSERTPFFHQLDVRAERMWLFNTWSLGAYLDIQNVYNTANVEAYEFDYRYRERAAVTSVPFLPTIGIRGQW